MPQTDPILVVEASPTPVCWPFTTVILSVLRRGGAPAVFHARWEPFSMGGRAAFKAIRFIFLPTVWSDLHSGILMTEISTTDSQN